MPAYSAFLVIHITFAAVAIPLLCYSLYKLYRSKPFNTKWTLSHIYLTSLLITIFCLPTSLVHGTQLFVLSPADKNTTVVNIADRILPAHSPLCVIQAQVLSFLLSPYILLPVLLSFYTFNAIRKNKASLESQSFKYAAGAIWGLGGVILIGNIISWRSQMIQEETVRHDHKQGNVSSIFDGIQTRGWVCQAHYVNNTFTYVIDGVCILALFTGLVLSVMSFSMIFSIWRRQIRRHAIGFRYSICITFATFLFTATHLPIFFLSGLIFTIDPNGSIIPRTFIIFSSCEILVGTYLLLILGGTYDGMHNEENEEVAGKDGLEDGNITVSELRFTYFV